jgi:serine/threonine protein kinase/tetratricopeptide (TPR) repeat protein
MKFVTSVPRLPVIGEPMQLSGLTDFATGSIDAFNQCRCGAVARVRSGLCARCLLGDVLEGDCIDDRDFEIELAEINVPDRDWRLGNYQILEEIARGGMGVVYRARHLPSRRIVAVKRVLTYHSDSQQTLARFQREAEAAASLDHPNILPIYDVGITDDGLPYFSMKFATAGSLLNSRDRFRCDSRSAAKLTVKVARAIDYAHAQGLVHRDLKPGNILLDARGEPMVADFGLAKWLDSGTDLTCTLTVFGTPGYIAPEQAQGSRVTQRPAVDIYSLGAILFELLSGRPPFLGEHALGVIRQATDKPAPRLRSLMSTIPRDLETICARCLDRDPYRRYGSAGELAEDIDRWIEDRPIVARPLSPPIRLWRLARRNRALAGSVCTSLVLLAAAIGWQIDSFGLSNKIRAEQVAAHSIVVMPFLNLDDGTANTDLAGKIADSLRQQMSSIGPAKVVSLRTRCAQWTGTGTSTELKSALRESSCRAALVGMYRQHPGGTRISLRFVDPASAGGSQAWASDLPTLADTAGALERSGVTASVYRMLDEADIASARQQDPAFADATARAYYNAGRALLDRRTIPDMDRAINCFEGAIKAAPESVLARSYLALALMGRNFLTADPAYIHRAYEIAGEALKLGPNDSSGHHALCALDIVTGHFDEALEHGLRALEQGDPTETVLGEIAQLWKQLGRPDRAIQWFAKAKVSENQTADYDALLGDSWLLLVDDERAARAFNTASQFRPDLPDGWLGLCYLKLVKGQFDEARQLFEQRFAEYKAFHNTRAFQAQLEFVTRNSTEAEQLYSDILRTDPNGVSAEQYGAISSRSALAKLRMEKGDKATATKLIQECIAQDQAELVKAPKHPEILYRLAADYAIEGNIASTLSYLKASIAAGYINYRSIQIDPRFDAVINAPEFRQIVSMLTAHVAELRQRSLTVDSQPNPK